MPSIAFNHCPQCGKPFSAIREDADDFVCNRLTFVCPSCGDLKVNREVVAIEVPDKTTATHSRRYFVTYLVDEQVPGEPRDLKTGVFERGAPIACLEDVRTIEAHLAAYHADKGHTPVVTVLNWKGLPS